MNLMYRTVCSAAAGRHKAKESEWFCCSESQSMCDVGWLPLALQEELSVRERNQSPLALPCNLYVCV